MNSLINQCLQLLNDSEQFKLFLIEKQKQKKSCTKPIMNSLLELCAIVGNLELCEFLTLSKDLTLRASVAYNGSSAFRIAASHGHLDVSDFLLLDERHEKKANLGFDNGIVIVESVNYNQLEAIKHLFNLDINQSKLFDKNNLERAFNNSIYFGYFEISLYFLTNEQFSKKFTISEKTIQHISLNTNLLDTIFNHEILPCYKNLLLQNNQIKIFYQNKLLNQKLSHNLPTYSHNLKNKI